jgi:hypothetical protein
MLSAQKEIVIPTEAKRSGATCGSAIWGTTLGLEEGEQVGVYLVR